MKKIIMVLPSGEEKVVGLADSIYDYLLATEEVEVTPLCGKKDYIYIDGVYCTEQDQIVSYKIEE